LKQNEEHHEAGCKGKKDRQSDHEDKEFAGKIFQSRLPARNFASSFHQPAAGFDNAGPIY